MLQHVTLTTISVTEATIFSVSNSLPTVATEPWFIQLWNAPGFSEFATGILVASVGIGTTIYTIRHQKKQEVASKKKQIAESILNPFNEVLLGFEKVGFGKDIPLMAQAVMTVYYSLDVEEKELRKQLNKAQTLARLYTPNYIEGLVSQLSPLCLGVFNQTKIDDSIFQQVKELVDELLEDLIKWIGSDEIKGKNKTIEDIAREIEEKHKKNTGHKLFSWFTNFSFLRRRK